MSEPARQQDPSMDEILKSIRRIVAEDAKQRSKRAEALRTVPGAERTAVLDLTEVVTADGSVFSIADLQQNRVETGEKAQAIEGPQPRAAAAALAEEAWAAAQGAWTRAVGLHTEIRSLQKDNAAGGADVLDRLAREQEALTRRLSLVGAVRDAVLAGGRLIAAVGEMVARDVGLPGCDLTTVAPSLRSTMPQSEPSLDSARSAWERVEGARASLVAAEQRLSTAEKSWAARRAPAAGGTLAADPLHLLESEHEHLVARSAVVAAQREEIVAAHALALEVQRLAERGLPT